MIHKHHNHLKIVSIGHLKGSLIIANEHNKIKYQIAYLNIDCSIESNVG